MNLTELKSILTRSVPGYLLAPEATFGEDKEKSVLSAFSFFVFSFILLLLGYYTGIFGYEIAQDYSIIWIIEGTIAFYSALIPYLLGYLIIQLLVIIAAIHLLTLFFKKKANFSDSLKISFISYAYWVLAMAAVGVVYNAASLYLMSGSGLDLDLQLSPHIIIVYGTMFIWVATNGINVLHEVNGIKSFIIAICAVIISILASSYALPLYLSFLLSWGGI